MMDMVLRRGVSWMSMTHKQSIHARLLPNIQTYMCVCVYLGIKVI